MNNGSIMWEQQKYPMRFEKWDGLLLGKGKIEIKLMVINEWWYLYEKLGPLNVIYGTAVLVHHKLIWSYDATVIVTLTCCTWMINIVSNRKLLIFIFSFLGTSLVLYNHGRTLEHQMENHLQHTIQCNKYVHTVYHCDMHNITHVYKFAYTFTRYRSQTC